MRESSEQSVGDPLHVMVGEQEALSLISSLALVGEKG